MGNQSSKSHKDKYKKNVHWKSAECPQAPGKPYLLPGLSTEEPEIMVTIKWQPPAVDGGSAIMGYIVEHKRTGSPNWVRATPQSVQFTELSISGLEPGWRYQFRVIAENAVGYSQPSEPSDPLTVTLQRNLTAFTAPRFLSELEDFNGIENEKVEFKVRCIGTPSAQISWFKDGFEIFSSRRAKIVTENDASTLIFYQASLTDEGEIKCTATNRAGYAFTKAHLSIEAPPKIRLPRQYEDGLIIEAEEVVRLKVGIAGRPAPSIEWSHNGEIITSSGRYEITSNDKNSTLKIANTNRTDRGEYHLRALNSLGEDFASFLVTVTARPTPPGKISTKPVTNNIVTLTWAPPEDDGGCKIGNYIVEYFRIGWNVWLKAATCRSLAVTLNDLISGSEYKFRVKAENPYGVSEPSVESDVLFIPDAKRGITDPTKSKSQSLLGIKSEVSPVAPRRRNPSQSPARSMLTEHSEHKKPSPIPQIKLNTKIFDDDTITRDMSYGTSDDFYKFKEVPSTSLHEKSGLEQQSKSLKGVKNNVKFVDEVLQTTQTKTIDEPIYANLPIKDNEKEPKTLSQGSKQNGNRTYLDLSKARGSDAHNSIQNSSEFMLVLYADKESKNDAKNDSFELEDYFEPPKPLSQSAPELNQIIPDGPILRRAVSSTELLFERAMARFYKAVEIEQTENARKRSFSVDDEGRQRSVSVDQESRHLEIHADAQDTALTHLRINSMTESEKMSVLRRRLSGDTPNLHINIPKRLDLNRDESFDEFDPTYLNTLRNEDINSPDMYSDERSPSPYSMPRAQASNDEEKFSSDYSESTESSNVEEEEDEDASPRRSRNRTNDKDTYHARMLSPYRQPPKDEAAEVLTKLKSPLPDPNFIPKPILKRPQSADGRKPIPIFPKLDLFKRRSLSPSPPANRTHRKSVEIDEKPIIIGQTSKEEVKPKVAEVPAIKKEELKVEPKSQKSPSPVPQIKIDNKESPPKTQPQPQTQISSQLQDQKNIQTQKQTSPQPLPLPQSKQFLQSEIIEPEEEEQFDPEILKRAEQTKRKMLERRQSSIEENRVMADFYGDIIKTVSLPSKPKVPIYMDPEALKKLEMEEEQQNDSGVMSAAELSPQSTLNRPLSPNPNRSPSPYSRRASESGRPLTFSPPPVSSPVKGRRASEAPKLLGKHTEQFSNLPLKNTMDTFTSNYNRLELNKSPSPQTNSFNKAPTEQQLPISPPKPPIIENEVSSTDERGRVPTKSSTGTLPMRRKQSKSRSRDTSMIRMPDIHPILPKSPVELTQSVAPITRRMKSSSRTRNRSESKSPTAMNRKIIINRMAPPVIKKATTPLSQSPVSSRAVTPSEFQEEVDAKVKSSMTHATDVSILVFATYIYFFKSALLALPILVLLIYRQIAAKIPDWMKGKKKKS
ncbi:hypothetical protein ACKWTF_003505 [Chironomus riparius]